MSTASNFNRSRRRITGKSLQYIRRTAKVLTHSLLTGSRSSSFPPCRHARICHVEHEALPPPGGSAKPEKTKTYEKRQIVLESVTNSHVTRVHIPQRTFESSRQKGPCRLYPSRRRPFGPTCAPPLRHGQKEGKKETASDKIE